MSGAIRFLIQYETGHGDFTAERAELFADLTVDHAIAEIEARATS